MLGRRSTGEEGLIVNILGVGVGRQTVVVNKGEFTSMVEPLTEGVFVLYRGLGLPHLQEAEIGCYFASLKGEYSRLKSALKIADMVNRYTVEGVPVPGIYRLLHDVLDALGRQDADVKGLELLFKWLLVREMGYRPVLNRCARCGGELGVGRVFAFSVEDGGIICRECRKGVVFEMLGIEEVKVLDFILSARDIYVASRLRISSSVMYELSELANRYIDFYMGNKGG